MPPWYFAAFWLFCITTGVPAASAAAAKLSAFSRWTTLKAAMPSPRSRARGRAEPGGSGASDLLDLHGRLELCGDLQVHLTGHRPGHRAGADRDSAGEDIGQGRLSSQQPRGQRRDQRIARTGRIAAERLGQLGPPGAGRAVRLVVPLESEQPL